MKCKVYHYGKHYHTKDELIKAIDNWIYYYTYVRYQRRFGVRTPDEVRNEVLASKQPNQYPIPENEGIIKYKQTHYVSSTSLAA